MEVSFLVFQKAVQPGGLVGLLGAKHAGRFAARAVCQPGGDIPVIWDLLGLGPLESEKQRGYIRWSWRCWDSEKLLRPPQLGGKALFSHVKAEAEFLAADTPHAADACEQLGASNIVLSSVVVRFLSWKGLFSRVTTTVQVSGWDGWLQPSFLWKRANSQ